MKTWRKPRNSDRYKNKLVDSTIHVYPGIRFLTLALVQGRIGGVDCVSVTPPWSFLSFWPEPTPQFLRQAEIVASTPEVTRQRRGKFRNPIIANELNGEYDSVDSVRRKTHRRNLFHPHGG
jgi:hypothetical protein